MTGIAWAIIGALRGAAIVGLWARLRLRRLEAERDAACKEEEGLREELGHLLTEISHATAFLPWPWRSLGVGGVRWVIRDLDAVRKQRDRLLRWREAAHRRLLRALEAPVEDGRRHVGEDAMADAARLLGEAVDAWLAALVREARSAAERAAIVRLAGRGGLPRQVAARRRLVAECLASGDVEVREAAVQAAELWGDPALAEVLDAHCEPIPWLADYVAQVRAALTAHRAKA